MTDADRLVALLHDAIVLTGMGSCVHSPENEWAPWCDVLARRLVAAGVTLARSDTAALAIEPYERECMVRDAEKGVAPEGSSMTRAEWDRRYLLERLAELRGGR